MHLRCKATERAPEPEEACGTAHSTPQITTSDQRASSESSCVDAYTKMSVPSTPAATYAAIHTSELLELILQHLSPRQLFATQRVCRAFRSTIAGSRSLQTKMLLRYPRKVSGEIDERQADDPPVTTHALFMWRIWTAGTLNPDYIASLSGLGLGGSATQVRCLQINAACPLCVRPPEPKSRFVKIKRAIRSARDPIPVSQTKALWRSIKLTRHEGCTVVVILRPYAGNCAHGRTPRRRMVEFPPGQGTLGDLDDCLRKYAAFDVLDNEREGHHFKHFKVATYVWSDGALRTQARSDVNVVGLRIAQAISCPPHVGGCRLDSGNLPDWLLDDIRIRMRSQRTTCWPFRGRRTKRS